jgi:RimJ/RimL family protein N-acetyltransferase
MLSQPLSDPPVHLLPFTDAHIEGLRAACAEDSEIWEIYPVSMLGEHFDPSLAFFRSMPGWTSFAVLCDDQVIGMTHYIPGKDRADTIEIGGTYIAPSGRGGPFNQTMKRLLIDHAFDCGFAAVELRVDTRNLRSIRAVEKLGATHVATVERDRQTWTGFWRSTAVFSIANADWETHLRSPLVGNPLA